MTNTGSNLGQTYVTSMPALVDNADIQAAFRMLWFGDPNATEPAASKGIETYLKSLQASIDTLAARKATDIIYSPTAPVRDTTKYSDWIWVDNSNTTPDGASRPVYVWNGMDWSPVAGVANPAASYTWSGTQRFNESLTIIKAINSYADSAARSAALSNPVPGTLSYLTTTNRYEYYDGSSWIAIGAAEKVVETRSATATDMVNADAEKVLLFTNVAESAYTVTVNQIKIGSSIYISRQADAPLTIVQGAGTIINANNLVLGKYASAQLTKVAANTYIVQGAGTAIPRGGSTKQALLKVDNTDYKTEWESIVPASGGTFTGAVTMPTGNISTANVVSLSVGGHKIFIQSQQPTGMEIDDVWIQI